MSAMNVVHMRVKPGKEQEFLAIHKDYEAQKVPGSRRFNVVATGERMYCIVGEWDSMDALIAARPSMIANLDRLRPLLEDLGGGRGVTEPWSGKVVLSISA
jgi:antibiotic biosynthesis monooxygenase (ABM) superfamily enzyme